MEALIDHFERRMELFQSEFLICLLVDSQWGAMISLYVRQRPEETVVIWLVILRSLR